MDSMKRIGAKMRSAGFFCLLAALGFFLGGCPPVPEYGVIVMYGPPSWFKAAASPVVQDAAPSQAKTVSGAVRQ